MAEPILEVRGLTKRFGALAASDGLDLTVRRGTVHGLIGPNGAGKTTAINQLSGELSPDSGHVLFEGRDVTRLPVHRRARLGLQRSYQITSLFPDFTALDNVAMAVQIRGRSCFGMGRPARRDPTLRDPARALLDRVGLDDRRDVVAGGLAHGEKRQLEIAMALAAGPRMLLLDEPMAGVGRRETRRLMDLLAPLRGEITLLLVEHDMDVVFALADEITVMVKGRAIASGPPESIRADREVRRAYLGDYG